MIVKYLHWIPLFLFLPSLPPPPFSPTRRQPASQSKAQKKLQPLTQVPVLQEQGEYCAGVGGVWTWVPAVWWGGVSLFLSTFSSLPSTFIFPLTSRDGLSVGTALIPFLLFPERCSTCWANIRLDMWASLWCVCASVYGLQRSVQLCVCVRARVCVLGCINTESTPCTSPWSVSHWPTTRRISLTELGLSHLTGQNPVLMGLGLCN